MSAGDVRQVRAVVRRGPAFDLPPFPEGQGVTRGDLVRIVDPAGLAVAWLDRGSARCVEFMVQSPEHDRMTWRSVFAVPDAFMADASIFGDGVPAAVGSVGPWIMGVESGSDRSGAGWYLLERDPTSVIMQTVLHDENGADSGNVSARFAAQLDDATLSLSLSVQNDGAGACQVAFGFRWMVPQGLNTESAFAPVMTTDTAGASHVGVTCNEGAPYREPGDAPGTGSLPFAMLGAPLGQPGVVLSGVQERLALSLARFSDAEGRTKILRLNALLN